MVDFSHKYLTLAPKKHISLKSKKVTSTNKEVSKKSQTKVSFRKKITSFETRKKKSILFGKRRKKKLSLF